VAVYGSDDCTNIGSGGACDVLIQEMPPTSAWGTDFAAVRFPQGRRG